TGISGLSVGVARKSLQLLTEAVPGVSRVAVLWNPANAVQQAQMLRETEAAARTLRVELRLAEARSPDEVDAAPPAMGGQAADATLILPDPVFTTHRARIVELVAKTRLPAMYPVREAVEAGGLMSYAVNYVEVGARGAYYMDKILKGAKPADLPVEQPT